MPEEHILICEDDDAFLASLSFILEDEGYVISTASNGKAALDKILNTDTPFDLVITDIQMPAFNGLQLIRSVRNSGLTLPVIVITGYGDKETLKELIRIGCDDFLDKPFEPEDLCYKVREVLEKHKVAKETYEKTHADLLKKHFNLLRELESYKISFSSLRNEIDSAAITYNDLISIKKGGYNVPVAYRIKALKRMGGDYADIRNTADGCDILIADVAGHDIAASYHTVLLKAFFDENCRTGKDGRSFFHILNHALLENDQNDRMITAIFLRLNLKSMQGEVVSAGHPNMTRLARKLPVAIPIGAGGSILGLKKRVSFNLVKFNLNPGDRLFLYTDGVINAHYIDGPTGRKYTLYDDGLDDLITRYKKFPLADIVGNVWNDVMQFCRHKPSDDMLLFGIEIPEE
ncbi:MAG: fused response regulator/phosphatase [Desulfobacterales bacterium]|nr:fused response regulator/phosphatase [Desulfobacterales bacterium]